MWPTNPIRFTSSSDSDYFARRAGEEQSAARKATCEEARERHEELAAMYRLRAGILSQDALRRSGAASEKPEDIYSTMWL